MLPVFLIILMSTFTFQGWNSSWDRFVPESLILKDDESGRATQLKLAEKAEAMFQAS
jgi:male-specific lethal 3